MSAWFVGRHRQFFQWCHLHLVDDYFLNFQVRYLGIIGGKDVAETTRRIMRSLMTTGVARQMNFAGRGSKTGISEMKILEIVVGNKNCSISD